MEERPVVHAPDADRVVLAAGEEVRRLVELHARDCPWHGRATDKEATQASEKQAPDDDERPAETRERK